MALGFLDRDDAVFGRLLHGFAMVADDRVAVRRNGANLRSPSYPSPVC
jgi:hypothetical protein